jgi:CheY-like chemotaxis protein
MTATVLYVDDDRNLCQIVGRALRGEGYEVRTAFDGAEAIASLREDPPDLVLLDLLLPRRDGFEVLEEIRSMPPPVGRLPVVLLSGCSPTPTYAKRARALGASELLVKPVPLEKLLEVVVCHVGEPKPMAASRRRARPQRARGLAGTLDRIPFPAVLHHLHGMRASGVLHLESGKKRKWIQLRDGYPVAVRSNLMRETLGSFLERTGRITRAILDESLAQLSDGRRHGEILVAMEVLTEEQVADMLREQADGKLFEIFAWERGSFRFELRATLQRANALGIGRSPANLILEGIRSRFPIERIDRYFRRHGSRLVSRGESPFYRTQEIQIDSSDEALLRGIDGTQCLADFSAEEERTRRTVYGLLAVGSLELSDASGTQAGAAAAPRPADARSPVRERVSRSALAEPGARVDRRQDDPRELELATLAGQLRTRDHFEILDVEPGVDREALREAYARVSQRTHPDRFSGASRTVRDLAAEVHGLVTAAYETLADPRARQQYLLDRKKKQREDDQRRLGERALEAETESRQGEAALTARDYEAALAHFGRALQLYPDDGDHHAHYGWSLYLCHPSDPSMVGEALEHVRRGIKLAGNREKPYLFMGRLYKAIGRADVAEKMFTRAVHIAPECVEALRELRLIHMRREKSKGLIGRLFRR